MADALTQVQGMIPSGASIVSGASQMMTIGTYVIIGIIILGVLCTAGFFIFRSFRFNKKIIIFSKVNNKWEQIGKDKAIEVNVGKGGDKVFYLQKNKSYKPRPEIQTGKNTYWYGIREDGEWINIGLEDIDLKMKKANVRYIHPDMRYAKIALERTLFQRHQEKKGFMEKYGMYLIPIIVFVICGLIMYFIADKLVQNQVALNNGLTSMQNLNDQQLKIMASIDHLMQTNYAKVILNNPGG